MQQFGPRVSPPRFRKGFTVRARISRRRRRSSSIQEQSATRLQQAWRPSATSRWRRSWCNRFNLSIPLHEELPIATASQRPHVPSVNRRLPRQSLPIQRRQSTPLPATRLHKIFARTRGAFPDDSIQAAKTRERSRGPCHTLRLRFSRAHRTTCAYSPRSPLPRLHETCRSLHEFFQRFDREVSGLWGIALSLLSCSKVRVR